MMKALVHGTRICEVVADGKTFPIHSGLQWVTVADDTVVDEDKWVDGAVVKYVAPVPTVQSKIEGLEAAVTPRRMRDAFSGDADALKFIADQEKLIAVERAKL